ncbi:TadE/TadG family type IV pilus assembly protein [Tundrisphaera lichenicola]|uniref:TadE/TadG family type IV pilus assembly protein n=1 Tax=Tundrisphaera lichenicola TaxID=2029860 RepID=UPI003EBFCEB4
MVESSIGLIFLLFVIFGIIEYGQVIMARQMLVNAARTAARAASSGRQAATFPDGTATPDPGGVVTTAFLNTWISKSLAASPLTSINPQYYGSNADCTPNTSIPWDSTGFGGGFFIDIRATYIPLFSGNRFNVGNNGQSAPIVGSATLRSLVFARAEANN